MRTRLLVAILGLAGSLPWGCGGSVEPSSRGRDDGEPRAQAKPRSSFDGGRGPGASEPDTGVVDDARDRVEPEPGASSEDARARSSASDDSDAAPLAPDSRTTVTADPISIPVAPDLVDAGVASGPKAPVASEPTRDPAVEPQGLADWLLGVWLIGESGDASCRVQEYLWFHSPPRLERIHVRQGCDVVGWSKAVEAGEYDVGDHIVTTTYEGRREQFSVAHGFIDDTRVLHFLAYAKDSETRYSSSSVTEALAGDGGIDRRLSVSTTLSFDRAIPIAGEGDCVVSAEYEVLRYERFDERGNELPEAEAEPALASASDPIACSYGPGEYGQEIRAATDFFDEESLPPEVSDKLRERMWIDRLDADVLFMEGWVFRYEVLPQGL